MLPRPEQVRRINVHRHAMHRFRVRFPDRVPERASDEEIAAHIRALVLKGLASGYIPTRRDSVHMAVDGIKLVVGNHPESPGTLRVITILTKSMARDLNQNHAGEKKRNAKRGHVKRAAHQRREYLRDLDSKDEQ